jgi:hypothetical protein
MGNHKANIYRSNLHRIEELKENVQREVYVYLARTSVCEHTFSVEVAG